jgi:hypothetical protein
MTTSKSTQCSFRVHNIVEYIKFNGEFFCDEDDLEDRGIQEILQQDFNIFETFSREELQEIKDEFQAMAIENEVKEAKHLIDRLNLCDEGYDFVHSSPDNIYGKRTAYKVYYSYPVDENLRMLAKTTYPLKSVRKIKSKKLSGLNKLTTSQIKAEFKMIQKLEQSIFNELLFSKEGVQIVYLKYRAFIQRG